MNTTARLSMLIGAGLVAGGIAAGPAQAAPAPPPRGQDTVIGLFGDQSDCELVGRLGDSQHRWDNPDCNRITDGSYRGLWKLTVQRSGRPDQGGWPGQGGSAGQGGWPGQGGSPGQDDSDWPSQDDPHGHGNHGGGGHGH